MASSVVNRIARALPVFSVDLGHAVAFREAWAFGQTIFQYDPAHKLCDAYRQVARELIERADMLSGDTLTPQESRTEARGWRGGRLAEGLREDAALSREEAAKA